MDKPTRKNARTLEEWVQFYEAKTGDKVDVPPGFVLLHLPERGFALCRIDKPGGIFFLYHVAGDARFWRDLAEVLANDAGLKCLCTLCTRNIQDYIGLFGWNIMEEYCKADQYRFICTDGQGRKVVITHKCINANTGKPVYYVTQYLREPYTKAGE